MVVSNHRDRQSQRCRVRQNKRGEDEEDVSLFFDEFRTALEENDGGEERHVFSPGERLYVGGYHRRVELREFVFTPDSCERVERRVSGGEVLVGNGVRVAGMVRSGREDDVLSRTDAMGRRSESAEKLAHRSNRKLQLVRGESSKYVHFFF